MRPLTITQEKVRNLFDYKSEGNLFWRSHRSNIRAGSSAGYVDRNGYIVVKIDGKKYFLHRLIFLYFKGYLPENEIDHINRIRTDNRIENLREVSRQCNVRNTGNRSDNKSGVKGVRWIEQDKKWLARIVSNQKCISLGYYEDFDDAVCARLAAEQCLGWAGCDSSSPAYQWVKNKIPTIK